METVTGDVQEVLKAGEEERNGESPDITPPLGCDVSTHWVEEIPDGSVDVRDGVNSSNRLQCVWMSLVEVPDQSWCSNVLLWFPRHVLQTIALPLYLELQFSPEQATIQYLLHLVLLLIVDQDRWGRRPGTAAWNGVVWCWEKLHHVEHRVELA